MDQIITKKEEERYAELQKMALGFARSNDSVELAKMLKAGLPVNLSDVKGQTLLMLASYNGNEETTKLLVGYGADVDRKNDRGQTPLGGVAFKGHLSIAKILIEAGADIHADNGGGMAPIHYAAMFGRWEVVELLEEHGASLNSDNQSGFFTFTARIFSKIRRYISG